MGLSGVAVPGGLGPVIGCKVVSTGSFPILTEAKDF